MPVSVARILPIRASFHKVRSRFHILKANRRGVPGCRRRRHKTKWVTQASLRLW